MLLEKGGEEILQEYLREEAKKRQFLRDKKWKKEDDAWKRMEKAGNEAPATSAGRVQGRRKGKGNLSVMRKQEWLVHQQ